MLKDFLDIKNPSKISVIGDSLLDVSYEVKVKRISPESPNCSVMLAEEDNPKFSPGGAAKIPYEVSNFTSMDLFTFTDLEANINCVSTIIPNKIPRKCRWFDGHFQVGNRFDIEKPNYGLNKEQILYYQNAIRNSIKVQPDVFIYSDYDKGIFSDTSFLEGLKAKHIIVDPKDHPISKWKNKCTIFKPNFKESYELSGGIKDVRERMTFFQKNICENIIITNEGNGFFLKEKDEFFEFKPKKRIINPIRLSGAGDVFCGILALALSYGFPLKESAIIAFDVCSVYVQMDSKLEKGDILGNF